MQVALNPHLVYNPFARVTAKSPLWYYNVTLSFRMTFWGK